MARGSVIPKKNKAKIEGKAIYSVWFCQLNLDSCHNMTGHLEIRAEIICAYVGPDFHTLEIDLKSI